MSDKLSELQPKPTSEDVRSPKSKSEAGSFEEPEPDNLEPLEPFLPHWEQSGGWHLLLRQPFRKQLTQNRFWKPAFVRVAMKPSAAGDVSAVRVFADDRSTECLHEVVLQPSYNLCEMGLQQMDQYGKCHTVKIQQVRCVLLLLLFIMKFVQKYTKSKKRYNKKATINTTLQCNSQPQN